MYPLTVPTPGTLEATMIANLDPVANGKGRPLTEYVLRVEQQADGTMLLVIYPEGFNHLALTVGIDGNTIVNGGVVKLASAAIASRKAAARVDSPPAKEPG